MSRLQNNRMNGDEMGKEHITTSGRIVLLLIALVLVLASELGLAGTEVSFAAVKKPAKVKLISVKRSGLKITAKWKKAKNAKKYQVYMKTGNGKWALKKTLKKLSLTVNGKYGRTYRFKVRGVNGKKKGAFSAVKKATIPQKVKPGPEEPEDEIDGDITILEEPDIQSARDGTEVTFTVKAEGKNLKYQWFVSATESNTAGKRINGANDDAYTVTASPATRNTFYYCVISNNSSSCKTKAAQLDVVLENHIYITKQPEPVTIYEGNTAEFTIETIGTGECFYQWYKNDKPSTEGGEQLEGETQNRLAFDTRLYHDDTYYYCKARDDISIMTSDIVKLDVEINPARTALVRDLKEFVEKNGVLSTETITIDGYDFYVLAEEDDKTLILAKEAWRRNDHLDPLYERWNGDDAQGNTRLYLHKLYLPSMPTLKYMAKEVTNKTPGDIENGEYYETRDKVFVLTEADVTGSYSRIMGETIPDDFSFDKTEGHIGRALPLEIAQLRDEDGSLLPWWVRTPSSIAYRWGATVFCNPSWVSYSDNESIQMNRTLNWPPYIRPALWVDLSIE